MFLEDSKEIFPKPLSGVVDEKIGTLPGRLRFQASYWPAVLDEDFAGNLTLKPGDRVTVIGRIGITLLVRPLK